MSAECTKRCDQSQNKKEKIRKEVFGGHLKRKIYAGCVMKLTLYFFYVQQFIRIKSVWNLRYSPKFNYSFRENKALKGILGIKKIDLNIRLISGSHQTKIFVLFFLSSSLDSSQIKLTTQCHLEHRIQVILVLSFDRISSNGEFCLHLLVFF